MTIVPFLRKQEIEYKRVALKEQIETTLALQKERSEPLNQVLAQIHEEGGPAFKVKRWERNWTHRPILRITIGQRSTSWIAAMAFFANKEVENVFEYRL